MHPRGVRYSPRVTADYDAKIYSATALREAAAAFSGHARITMRRRGERYVVRFEPATSPPTPLLLEEFGNYALGRTIQQKREK